MAGQLSFFAAVIAAAAVLGATGAAKAQEEPVVRVGYWAGGVSAGIGFTLELGEFLEAEGLNVEYSRLLRLADVNRAIITDSIDIAVAGGTVPTLRSAVDGVPAKVILANLVADTNFVVAGGSGIDSLEDLRGKTIGSTPEGSTTHSLVAAIVGQGYGLERGDYEYIGAGEGQLATLLSQGDINAALLRSITIATVGGDFKVLASAPSEWRRIFDIDSPPILGLTVVTNKFLENHPDLVEAYLVANIKATQWGSENPEKVADFLQAELGMDRAEALAYAQSWDSIYFASLTEDDIRSVDMMADLMREAGEFEGEIPDGLFVTEPFARAAKKVGQ